MKRVLDRVCDLRDNRRREALDGFDETYFLQLVLFHEQMHAEAITYTRQSLGYPPPRLGIARESAGNIHTADAHVLGDAFVHDGKFVLGCSRGATFAVDNVRQAHTVE